MNLSKYIETNTNTEDTFYDIILQSVAVIEIVTCDVNFDNSNQCVGELNFEKDEAGQIDESIMII